jgi:hypothetical protein
VPERVPGDPGEPAAAERTLKAGLQVKESATGVRIVENVETTAYSLSCPEDAERLVIQGQFQRFGRLFHDQMQLFVRKVNILPSETIDVP